MEYREDIYELHQRGIPERKIALELKLPLSTVHYWIRREGRRAESKSGRPKVTNLDTDRELYKTAIESPFTTAVDLRHIHAPHCSVSTVRNRLKEMGLRCRIPARKPFLTQYHKAMRYAFALDKLSWSKEYWNRVVFSDEKIFRASSRGPLRVYRPKSSHRFDERYLVPTSNPFGRFTVAVWMAFSGSGKLRIIQRIERPTLNADYYTSNILPTIERTVLENGLIFMQDLSSIHTSRLTTHVLRERNWRVMWDWPPKGPDMNPVENIWAELVRRIEEWRRSRDESNDNRDQLWEDIQAAFESLGEDYFDGLVDSMSRRIHQVVLARGGWTKY
jgi:Mn-dependent DtxR family transcriptional regulator